MSLVIPFEEIFASEDGLLARHESWERVELDLVAKVLNGFAFKSRLFSKDKGFPLIRIRDIARSVTETFYASGDYEPQYVVRRGDLLVGMDGNFGCYEWKGEPGLLNQRVCKITPNPSYLDPKFFFFGINGHLAAIQDATSSLTVGHLSSLDLMRIPFPLPPLAEQRRIVAAVEAVLAKVNAARERLNRVPAILKRFRQVVLAAACSGRLTADWRGTYSGPSARETVESARRASGQVKVRRDVPEKVELPAAVEELELPDSWCRASVAELLRSGVLVDVKDGNHGSNHPKVSEFTPDGLPFITAAQVNGFSIDYETAYRVSGAALAKLRVGFAHSGDAVLTHKGSVGRSALNTRECVLTPQTTYYRCRSEVLDAAYLVYLFASPQFFGQLANVMSQTTRDFVPISEQYLLYVFVPPPAEQREIVRRVGELFALADRIEDRLTDTRRMADQLTQAVLAKAFRGELVPTEAELARREKRTYESAADLLARIRAVRAKGAGEPTKKKRPARPTR